MVIDTQSRPASSQAELYKNNEKYTVFEINTAWQKIVEDFKNFEPMLGSMLDETLPQKTDYEKDPYPLTLQFPAHKKMAFEFLTNTKNKHSTSKVAEYLQIVLDKSIRLEFILKDDPQALQKRRQETSRQRSPDYYFILDKEKTPLLNRMEELFETEFKFTRPIQVEDNDPTKDMTDEYAEDA